ncbi:ribonuclease H, partial [Trifolium pratense]
IDGAALGCPGKATCTGIFRNHLALFMGCFTLNIDQATDFHAELMGFMQAIEIAHRNSWWNLWLEIDSSLATLSFKASSMIP